jgi:tetratricopeptide (TPR) repeat protein
MPSAESHLQPSSLSPTRRWWMALLLVLVSAIYLLADWLTTLPENAEATFVGRQTCAECHAGQMEKFQGSFHDKAMDLATDETVLGDFQNAELSHYGVTSRMFRRDKQFWIHTEGPDGKLADFEIKYVFGVDPLQQYMVEFDRTPNMPEHEVGRLQVLRVSWDTQAKKWFHLDPPDVKEKLEPDDVLHWTGTAQCWNNMCADCHSTNLQKNFYPQQGRYHTTFSEIDVSCEACHGPGSLHVQLANTLSPFWDRKRGYAIESLQHSTNIVEVEACAPCHSRRRVLAKDFQPGKPFHDFFGNETLHRLAYHADGQNLDEVYEYGSFTQSKMFHKNIRCSDCHDPHSTKLKHTGNQLCTSCHTHPAGKYDSVSHHHHAPNTPGASCVECHMPHGVFMEVDARRDHGLRVPRPDLSLKHNTPNACTQCHLQDVKDLPPEQREKLKHYSDWLLEKANGNEPVSQALTKIDAYCAEAFARWYPDSKPHKEDVIAPAFAAARNSDSQAGVALAKIVRQRELPDIVRATAVTELGAYVRPGAEVLNTMREALHDSSPQVRAAAIPNLETLPPDELRTAIVPLLTDKSRLVRMEAGRALTILFRRENPADERNSSSGLRAQEHEQFHAALQEYLKSLEQINDRAAGHLAKGAIHENMNEFEEAEQCYRTALRLEPNITGPRSNLAALLERRMDQSRHQAELAARQRKPELAVQFMEPVAAYQITVEKLRQEELKLYERDARLAPKNGAVQYRLGLNYYLNQQFAKAEMALRAAVALEPRQVDYCITLALLQEKQGRPQEALPFAEQALQLWPEDAGFQEIVSRLKTAVSANLNK